MHDHISFVNAAAAPRYLMYSEFGPNLATMSRDPAPRHGASARLLLGLGAVGLALAAGCGGKAKNDVDNPGEMAGAPLDTTRCDPRGKQIVVMDTNNDKKPDVTKLYETSTVNGVKAQVLVCKQVDLNYDGKVDIVYHYDQAGTISYEEFDLDF